jgi:hypothetical protein
MILPSLVYSLVKPNVRSSKSGLGRVLNSKLGSLVRLHIKCTACMQPPLDEISAQTGNTKGGSITVLLTSCLTGLESAV